MSSTLLCALLSTHMLGLLKADVEAQGSGSAGWYRNAPGAEASFNSNFTLVPGLRVLVTTPQSTLNARYGLSIFTSNVDWGDPRISHNASLSGSSQLSKRWATSARASAGFGTVDYTTVSTTAVLSDDVALTLPETGTFRYALTTATVDLWWDYSAGWRLGQLVNGQLYLIPEADDEDAAQNDQLRSLLQRKQTSTRTMLRGKLTSLIGFGADAVLGITQVDSGARFLGTAAEFSATLTPRGKWSLSAIAGAESLTETGNGTTRHEKWVGILDLAATATTTAGTGKRVQLSARAGTRPYFDPLYGTLEPRTQVSGSADIQAFRQTSLRTSVQWSSSMGIPDGMLIRPGQDQHVVSMSSDLSWQQSENLGVRLGVKIVERWQQGEAPRGDVFFVMSLITGAGIWN